MESGQFGGICEHKLAQGHAVRLKPRTLFVVVEVGRYRAGRGLITELACSTHRMLARLSLCNNRNLCLPTT